MSRDQIPAVLKRLARGGSAFALAAMMLTALSVVPAEAQYRRTYRRTTVTQYTSYPTTYYAPVRRYVPVRRSYVPVRRVVPVRRTYVRSYAPAYRSYAYAPSYRYNSYRPWERRMSTGKKVAAVAAGTAGGALVGGLVGGKKGALIGALIGGAGSGAAVYARSRRDRDRYYYGY